MMPDRMDRNSLLQQLHESLSQADPGLPLYRQFRSAVEMLMASGVLKPGDPLHWAAEKGLFHQLRPIPEKRLGVLAKHDMHHGGASSQAA